MSAGASDPEGLGATLRARIGAWLDEIGPRPSCSPAERALGARLEEAWGAFVDEVRAEPFRAHPHAFLGSVPLASMLTLAGLFLLSQRPAVAAALAGVAWVVLWFELVRSRELIDRLTPSAEGTNIVGVLRPSGAVHRRLILSAHQDSAWEFNLWAWFGNAALPLSVVGLLTPLALWGVATLAVLGWVGPAGLDAATWVGVAVAPVVALHLVFHTGRPVPGAMDDLAGLVVIGAVGEALAVRRLEHTEVVLLACAAEECGLRGARRFAARHAAWIAERPTFALNVDGVYDERFLSVVSAELGPGVRHDPALVQEALRVAASAGHTMRRVVIPFGGTDGAALAQGGVRTVSLLCQDTDRLAPNYHTRLDTLDRVRPQSLAAMHAVVEALARRIDAGAVDRRVV